MAVVHFMRVKGRQGWRTKARPALVAVALLGAVLPSAFSPFAFVPSARADQSEPSAAEMLQDGLDALIDRQMSLANELFEEVIRAFPGTPESVRAKRELSALGSAVQPTRATDDGDVFARRLPSDEPALRMKFATDAGDRVFFAENSSTIGGRARALLEHQARWLMARPEISITIIGRADDGASTDASRELSAKRAEAVRDKLAASGIALERMTIDARGSRDPVATCRSDLCQAQNRHAETSISFAASSSDRFGDAGAPSRDRPTTVGGAVAPAVDGIGRGVTVSR